MFQFTNCKQATRVQITNANDYNSYLNISEHKGLEQAKQNELFWSQKLEQTPNQFPYKGKLAATYSNYFNATGQIDYLIKAEDYLVEVNEITHYNNASYLKSLAYNCISQHKFKEALSYLNKAEILGENIQETRKMLFDVYLELGNYEMAHTYLNTFENFSDFDYLIRLSKWSDHNGNLCAAIKYMEKAQTIAEASNLKPLKQWAYTNIADFYGHAGDIEKSYTHYLKALALDPNDAYAKKGIAWIVYSYEKNPEEALRILDATTSSFFAPDYFLLKAEIAEYLGDKALAESQLELYENAMKNEAYGNMYNKYNVLLSADTKTRLEDAITLAKTEVENRPTPQSYDLLAWAYFNNGNLSKALQIVDRHIIDKTYEPETLYHVAEIYKAAGKIKDLEPLKKELLASTFELGPIMEVKIQNL
ncbi:MAG: cell surface protein [Psychroserpens sp.]|nr:cell surface protein [Psychroserpens sp.]